MFVIFVEGLLPAKKMQQCLSSAYASGEIASRRISKQLQLSNQIRSTEIGVVHQGSLIIRNETLGILSNLAIESRNRVYVSGQMAEN